MRGGGGGSWCEVEGWSVLRCGGVGGGYDVGWWM